MGNAIGYIVSAALILSGFYGVVWPEAMAEFQQEPSDDDMTPPTAQTLRTVCWTSVLLIAVGLAVLYFCLFGEPADEPSLI